MALQPAAQGSQGEQLLLRQVSAFGERGIKHRRGVTVTEEEDVTLRPVRFLRIVPEHMGVQHGHEVRHAERARAVATAGRGQHGHNAPAKLPGERIDFLDVGESRGGRVHKVSWNSNG